MLIARCVSCDERGRQRLSKEGKSELEATRLGNRVGSQQRVRPQDNLLAQRNSTLSSADSRSVRNVPLVPLDKRQRACRRVDLRLDGPTLDEALQRRLDRVDRPPNIRDVSAMSTTQYA